ncbi:1-deoxy-D-xylulose-5-phosphate reductoisomerase [Brachybacterium saurashtrense]|uniref:1-deoxy-D-xylulose 5-phosphate reductoisomerase n=1 Tax=Brachybacterium saurashtrense TaxID=556288 RepID=A0A345YKX7_9MICO|nr:1-deoxy-D-xylulose-5-phosphate reductoisomerase [Brachybacterium saurashtrense]AXK44579.1 1-deoxy-D-xylulose-5-phosphate reductoisomerase [Brachybacterium saurashtrense]RRR23191.1 1-deoxy-D-xylulose-5-phosphate reductoisomerase [Brachybacterium saurashtrense]
MTGTPGRRLVLLGATGSIGTQALDVLTRYPHLAQVHGLAVGGSRPELVAQQVLAHRPAQLVVSDPARADDVAAAVHRACREEGRSAPRLETGPEAVSALAGALGEGDVVLNAITGSVGLLPTLAALASGARLALANKESLVVGGHLVTEAAAPGQILPVDSEHTAIAQALAGVRHDQIDHLVVTASGGPFRGRTREQLAGVTPQQALAHPTWSMGRVITTNSATLVNKALEVIEACFQFDLPEERVQVVVHPQSIVHSMVTLVDGSTIAQASPPDMRHAIGWALAHPEKLPGLAAALDFSTAQSWTFEPVDEGTFDAIALARAAHREGGGAMAVYNAANEEAVDAFFAGTVSFLGITGLIREVLEHPQRPRAARADGVEGLLAVEDWARRTARTLLTAAES